MSDIGNTASTHLFAGFQLRLRSAFYDTMLLTLFIPLMIGVAIATGSDEAARIVGLMFLVVAVLYEPVLVSWRGYTIGHNMCGLRVVDDKSGANPSFSKALIRFFIKLFLGWASYITMAASRRKKAIHDAMTGSSVLAHSASAAEAQREIEAAAQRPAPAGMPSRLARFVAIIVYAVLSFGGLVVAFMVLVPLGALSARCLDTAQCSGPEKLAQGLLSLAWLALIALIVGAGWRGRLPGCRIRLAKPEQR